jgi:transposase
MARPQKEPLRQLTEAERQQLQALARSRSAPADRIVRAQALLAVADGATFAQAATEVGWHRYQSVSDLVVRFHRLGMDAIYGQHGGGPAIQYGSKEQARILQEFARTPDREQDQTATWSLTTLQRALRRAPDGLPKVSTYVILQTLHRAGYTCQKDRTWCPTGTVQRKRKEGVVAVTDPAADEKRGTSSRRTP